MQAKNLHRFRSLVLFLIAISNIALSIPLAKVYGSIGAAIGTGISLFIGNIIVINLYYHYKAKINMKKYWMNMISMTLRMILPLCIVVLMLKILSFGNVINLLFYIPIYILLYCLCCYYLVMNEYEKGLINSIFNRILKIFGKKDV